MIVNVKKAVVDANNNESLREHISLLKPAVENNSRLMSLILLQHQQSTERRIPKNLPGIL